jgi:mannose-1-phosphate guanylyltransferase
LLIPVILSGGAGTRLWLVSREAHPKPFIVLRDGQSLMQKTLLRAAALKPDSILTITNRDCYEGDAPPPCKSPDVLRI